MNNDNINCDKNECRFEEMCPGYAFVHTQVMGNTYEPNEALKNGTMFPELNIPLGQYLPGEETGGRNNG